MTDYTKKPANVNKRFTWSYSRYNLFNKCKTAFNMYVHRKDFKLPAFKTNPAMERGNMIHKKAEEYVKGNITGVPKEMQCFSAEFKNLVKHKAVAEQDWWINDKWEQVDYLDWNNVWLMVKSDAHVIMDDSAIIIDYKTGKVYDSHEKQAELYAVAALSIFDSVESVETEFWYLDQQEISPYYYEKPDLIYYRELWDERAVEMQQQKTFDPSPSFTNCNWCEFKSVCEFSI